MSTLGHFFQNLGENNIKFFIFTGILKNCCVFCLKKFDFHLISEKSVKNCSHDKATHPIFSNCKYAIKF